MNLTIGHLLLALLVGAASTAAAQTRPRFINPASLPPSRGYTQVVEVPAGERLVYISGQVPLDKDGNLVGAGDFRRKRSRCSPIWTAPWPPRARRSPTW